MDFNIKLSNRQVLRGIIISPGEKTRAVIIFVHGLGEHVRRYLYWAGLFRDDGIGFAGVDLPGHGRSDGRRGNIGSYRLLGEMIDILIRSTKKTFPGVPVFLYGHSLGGGIVIDYLLRTGPDIKGAIVTSPWLKLSFEPPKGKMILASVVRFILPGLTQPSGLVVEHISHDEEEVEKYKSDPLIHGLISVSLFYNAVKAGRNSLNNASGLKVPTLLLHGSDDHICSPDGSREFASKSELVELRIWDGGFHELHNEPFKEEVFTCILNWINGMLS